MVKSLKKIYLPAGLVASLYNVYGGRGEVGDALTSYDIQLLCAYTEFYFNYTNIEKKENVFWFYSIPQFYKAYRDITMDELVQKENSTLEGLFVKRIFDDYIKDNPNGELYLAAKKLASKKRARVEEQKKKGILSEIDPAIYDKEKNPSVDYSILSTNPFEFAEKIEKEGYFRTQSLYKRERVSRVDRTKKLPVFGQKPCQDASCFFVLNPKTAHGKMSGKNRAMLEKEMQRRLQNYFNSDCYKALSDNKKENYAPTVTEFIENFKKAIDAFNSMNFIEDNRAYSTTIKQAEDSLIDIELVSE